MGQVSHEPLDADRIEVTVRQLLARWRMPQAIFSRARLDAQRREAWLRSQPRDVRRTLRRVK
jgi:hypothetical protein